MFRLVAQMHGKPYDPKEDLVLYRTIHARRAERESFLAAKQEMMRMQIERQSAVSWEGLACKLFVIALLAGLFMQYQLYIKLSNLAQRNML